MCHFIGTYALGLLQSHSSNPFHAINSGWAIKGKREKVTFFGASVPP